MYFARGHIVDVQRPVFASLREECELRAVFRERSVAHLHFTGEDQAGLSGGRVDQFKLGGRRRDVRRIAVARVVDAERVAPDAHRERNPPAILADLFDARGAHVECIVDAEGAAGAGLLRLRLKGDQREHERRVCEGASEHGTTP
jgi:hypothetical protein